VKTSKSVIFGILIINFMLLYSCATTQTIFHDEPPVSNNADVRVFLENVYNSFENYIIQTFSRTALSYRYNRSNLLTHSFYVFIDNEGEYNTLSFNGKGMKMRSTGSWIINSLTDFSSYTMYLNGNNRWDVEEIFNEDNKDVKSTIINIINQMDSGITYYYRDHIKSQPNTNNCNTALFQTLAFSY